MAEASAGARSADGLRTAKGRSRSGAKRTRVTESEQGAGPIGGARFEAAMRAAELSGKSGRIGGRVSPALVAQAKRLTGVQTDTDLIEFALATVALEDGFAEAFADSRGKVDGALKLGY